MKVESVHFGKVRNCFVLENKTRILHATDRVSAFDRILPFEVPRKGEILQALSVLSFEQTADLIPNHLIGCLDRNHLLAKECDVLPLEIIVRGFLAGSLWRLYSTEGPAGVERIYGIKLPSGLSRNEKLPTPILTPTSKAAVGHDLPLTGVQCIEVLRQNYYEKTSAWGSYSPESLWAELQEKSLAVYTRGSEKSALRNLILVDAIYEFGLYNGQLLLVDEIHTPDCARYWYANEQDKENPRQLSKEFLREELVKTLGAEILEGFTPQHVQELEKKEIQTFLATRLSEVYEEVFRTLAGAQTPFESMRNSLIPWPLTPNAIADIERDSWLPRKVLIVGNGGRDYTLFEAFASKVEVETVYCAPGNRNWGAKYAECPHSDVTKIAQFAKENGVGLIVAGPEQPIAEGLEAACFNAGIPVLAPNLSGASLEASKMICKQLMLEADIPTAPFEVITGKDLLLRIETSLAQDAPCLQGLNRTWQFPFVIKYDCLAAGKGVFVVQTKADLQLALDSIRAQLPGWDTLRKNLVAPTYSAQQGQACFLIEECLQGSELSAFALCNGTSFRMLPFARDYKRRNDGQTGPNTGGMGAISPLALSQSVEDQIRNTFERALKTLAANGTPYRGFLFAGFMMDSQDKLWLLEFNCRLGDPETQVVIPGLGRDFYLELMRTAKGLPFRFQEESGKPFRSDGKARVYVVGASPEYPDTHALRRKVLVDQSRFQQGVEFVPSAVEPGNVTTGGRALGVLASATTLEMARKNAYEAISGITLQNENGTTVAPHFRKDVGAEFAQSEPVQ